MKKFLSLVLALVMTASLVTVSAGAKEFKDDKDVTYDEAVAVISEIGVVDGDTDGNFRPTDNLSRGAAAKIICNLILGPTTAAELKADTAPYKDVPVSNTFSGYIAYCAKEGIISGYADGSFRPAGTLTGYAFMKMLLGALGYDGTYEGYTGANWSINVAKQAIGIGLNKGLTDEFNGVDFVTREEAALYAFNTLKATMVDYDQKITTNVNGVDVTISQGNAKPVTWTEGKNNDGNIKDDKFVQFAEEFFPDLVRKGDSTKFEAPANTWVYDKVEIGTYERTDLIVESYTTEVTGKDVYDLLKASVIKDNELKVYEDGKDKYGENSTDKVGKDDLVRSNNNKLITTGDGALTKVYLDTDKDEITIVTINTYLAKASADYSESKEYASLGVYETSSNPVTFNVDVEDVANVVDVKKDAFYQVTVSYKDATRGEVVTVGDVEILEDSTVTKFSTKKNDDETASRVSKLTTGGEEYKANVKAYYDDDVLDLYDDDLLTGKTYNVYVDSNGYFLGVDLFEGTKNYVFITGYDKNISNLSIKTADAAGIFLDGTMKTIKVNVTDTNENIDAAKKENKDNASHFDFWSSSSGEFDHNRWYTYTEADGVFTLKPAVRMTATTSMKGSNDVIRTDALSLVDDINKNNRVYGEDATVFLTVDTGKVGSGTDDAITEVSGVYTGVQNVEIEVDLKSAVKPHIYTVYDSDHYVIAAVVLGESIGSNQNLAYILSGAKSEEIKDGVYYWEFEAVMNGEVKTLTAKSKYKSTITTLKNSIDEVVELRFDGDYVVDVKDDVKLYTNTAKHIDGEAAYYMTGLVNTQNTVSYQGGTMYIRNDKVNDVGLGIAKDAKAVVIQKENNKEKKTEFTSVEAAIAHLADPDNNSANGKQYNGIIAAGLNANGTAAWVVFDSATELKTGAQTGSGSGSGKYFTYTNSIYEYGMAAVSVTANRPAWLDAADADALAYSFDIYVNGTPYETGVTGTAIDQNKTSAIKNWDNSSGNMFLFRPVKANDKITVENFKWTNLNVQTYKVKYVDKSNNELNASMFTTMDNQLDNSGDTLAFTLNNKVVTGTAVPYTVVGVSTGASGSYAYLGNTVNSGAATSDTVAAGKIQKVVDVNTVEDLEDYVYVQIDTSALNDYAGPWEITLGTNTANPNVALNTYKGVDSGETTSLVIKVKNGTSLTSGSNYDTKNITVELSGAASAAYAYKVEIAGYGSAIVSNATPVDLSSKLINVTSNLVITKDMVTVTPVEKKQAIENMRWDDAKATVTLTFAEKLAVASVADVEAWVDTTNVTFNDNGVGNTGAKLYSVSAKGNVVTLTFTGTLKENNKITLTSLAQVTGLTAANACSATNNVLTLGADGSVTAGTV